MKTDKPGMVFALLLISMYSKHQKSAADEKVKFNRHVMKIREAVAVNH
jgi:hypothetical protein